MAQFLWYDCTFKKQCTVPVTLTFDLWQAMFFQWIDNDPISALYNFQIDISTNSWEIKYQNMGIGLLHVKRNVAHVKNDVKWRPIVTKFGTLIENMSRTGLYDCHIFRSLLTILWELVILVWEFYMLKTIFCDVICLLAHVFIVSSNRVSYEVSIKKNEIFLWNSFCDMDVPSKSNVPSLWPWPLTYEGQIFLVDREQHYKYPVSI